MAKNPVTMRLEISLIKSVKLQAEKEGRSFGNMVEWIFKCYLRGSPIADQKAEIDKLLKIITDLDTAKMPTKREPAKRMKRPTYQMVSDYFSGIGNANFIDDACAFLDHYNSNGWLVTKAKTPMKCWKSSCNNWIRRGKQYEINKSTITSGRPTAVDRVSNACKNITGYADSRIARYRGYEKALDCDGPEVRIFVAGVRGDA